MSKVTAYLVISFGLWSSLVFAMAYEAPLARFYVCDNLRDEHRVLSVEQLYARAFTLSFNDDFKNAEPLAACAAELHHGYAHWKVEAKTFFN